jgi:uncharacterized protein (TIGR03437 family)
MTISANGGKQDSGILWESTGDYNAGTAGTLHAYDASNLANEVWNSDMNPARDLLPPVSKFAAPTVANGKVYVPGFANAVTVYGLFAPPASGGATPSIVSVTHAASYSADAIAPGELVAIFGSSLGPAAPAGMQLDDAGGVATTLAGTQVLFDGVASPMAFASAGQIDAVVPFGVAAGRVQAQVQYQGLASALFPVTVVPAVSGIFSADGSGAGQAIVLNQDGGINSPAFPAAPGSVVTLWATGAGQLSPAVIDGAVDAGNLPRPVLLVLAQIGRNSAEVVYAGGSPGMVEGVIQINLRIPFTSQTGDAVPLVLRIGNSNSQLGITLAIRSADKTAGATRWDFTGPALHRPCAGFTPGCDASIRMLALPPVPAITGTRNRCVALSYATIPIDPWMALTMGATGEYPVIASDVSPAANVTRTRAEPRSVYPATRFFPMVTNWPVSPTMAIPEGPTGANTR